MQAVPEEQISLTPSRESGNRSNLTPRTKLSQSKFKKLERQEDEEPQEMKDSSDDDMESVPSEDANIEIDNYVPVVGVDTTTETYTDHEMTLDEYGTPGDVKNSQLQTSLQASMVQANRKSARGSMMDHVGGWGGGMDNSRGIRASSPDIYNFESSRHMSGQVEEVEDQEQRKSRFLEKRRQMIKEAGVSVSVDRRASTSFQELNILKMMDQSRRSSVEPSVRYSPRSQRGSVSRRMSGVSVLKNSSQVKLQRQPTDNFTVVFRRAGLDSRLLQQRLMNANKVSPAEGMRELATVGESQNRVRLNAESAALQDEKKKVERMTAVQFMEKVLSMEQVEILRSIFLKHSSVSDKKGESVMKSWQFRKFCADFGLAEGIKALAQMEVLYNSSTRDKSGHAHQMNLGTFLKVLIQIAKKNFNWQTKEQAFKSLVERYLMKKSIEEETKQSLEFDVALRQYFRAFKYDQLQPELPPKVLDEIYCLFCYQDLSGINVTGFQKLTRHLRINPVFCSDLQAKKVYKYLEQMKLEAGPVLKKQTLQIALYLLFLPAVESDAPFSKRWKFMVKWIISAHYKLKRPIK